MAETATKQTQSPAVSKIDEILAKAELVLSPEQYKQHGVIIKRIERAKTLKQQRYKYYDGMTYDEDYASNENLKNTYLTPKMNETETRVNTGTAEKKLDAIKNELLTMNLQHEIKAYDDEDLEVQNLGDDLADVVTRTNQIEKDEDLMEEATDELLTQRVVYIRETYQSLSVMRGKQTIQLCKKELVSGLKVFPGSWTIPAYLWDTMPYVVTIDRVGYEYAEAIYKDNPNWQHVKPNTGDRNIYLGGAFSYQFGELQDGELEIIRYESLPDNEMQEYVGGVPMHPPGKTLESQMPKYALRAYTAKSMSRHFLAGRPFTAMAKTMQAMSNEFIRLFIRKTQQSLEPPMATPKGGKIHSRDIFNPGAWTQGLRKNDFEKLIDHQGVTAGEMAIYKLVDEEVEKFIGTHNIAQGMQGSREMSATEVLTITKQFLKQLGYTVAALMRMKRDLTEMRVYNVFENYLDPIKRKYDDTTKQVQEVYRSFTLDGANFSNNRKGKKIIKMFPRDLTKEEQKSLYQYEEEEAKKGNNVRIRFLNVEKLKSFSGRFHVIASVQDKEGTALDKVTFQDQLNQGALVSKLTGKLMNPDVVTEIFERKWKAKDWFQVQAPQDFGATPMNQESSDGVRKDAEKMLGEIEKMGMEGSMGSQISRGQRSAAQSMGAQEMASA